MNRLRTLALASALLLDAACGGSIGVHPDADGGPIDSGSRYDASLDAIGEPYADGPTLDGHAADGPYSADGADSSDGAEEPPPCVPKTCAALGVQCLTAQDGCGGVLNCGSCAGGGSCSATSAGPVCGPCIENCHTCAQLGMDCGFAGDGSGGLVFCGECPPPSTCGGGGVPGQCGGYADTCLPKTCLEQGAYCGTADDGCGNTMQCGTCPTGQTCGGKRPGVCGSQVSEAGL